MMLSGKRIVVTGAARGIGRAIAYRAAMEGAVIGINYRRSESAAAELAGAIVESGGHEPRLLRFDATSLIEVENALEEFCSSGNHVDGWVNNAAINISGLLPTIAEEEIQQQISSALVGPMTCCKVIAPQMMRCRSGSIVNIGSVVSRRPFRGQSVYAAAKGGLDSFTKALAAEYGRKGVRANCVLPGMIETDMLEQTKKLAGGEMIDRIPLGRFGTPDDVAGVVAFLLSDESSYVTGTSIAVDGGL